MILLTGATGYVGGRLLRRLEREGSAVRCVCRNPETLAGRVAPGTELLRGDLLKARVSGRRVPRSGHSLLFGPFHEQPGRVRG